MLEVTQEQLEPLKEAMSKVRDLFLASQKKSGSVERTKALDRANSAAYNLARKIEELAENITDGTRVSSGVVANQIQQVLNRYGREELGFTPNQLAILNFRGEELALY